MEGNLLNDPTMSMMYNDALLDLMAGAVNPIDKEILSYTPLPDSVIDPYASQEMQAKAAMDLTFSSLSTWIGEAKKASYFTKHFVVLSKMINNGVASMARGLATLHACGEDLSAAPLSIRDLISVASYHIRKSYLGVIQTSRSHPEIGEQLVLNQLSWTNTLLRLFKTKEKLSKPVCKVSKDSAVRIQCSADGSQVLPAPKTECGGLDDLSALSGSGELNELPALPEPGGLGELPALSEPGSYGPARAFAPYSAGSRQHSADSSRRSAVSDRQTADRTETSEIRKQKSETGEIRNQKSEIRNDSETAGKIEIRENEKPKEEPVENDFGITENVKSEEKPAENDFEITEKGKKEEWPEDENNDFSEDDFFDEEDFLNLDWFDPHYKPIPIPVRNVSKNHNSPDTS